MKTYTINTSGLSYFLIILGIKKVECKINRGIYSDMKVGDIIIWTNKLFYSKSIRTTIINKSYYDNFREYSIFPNLLLCGSRNETMYGITVIKFEKEDETDLVDIPIQTIFV